MPEELPEEFEVIEPRPPSIYEHVEDDGVTVWDWYALADKATHTKRYASDGGVEFFYFDELLLTLSGEPARAFWEWSTAKRQDRRRRHRRNPRGPATPIEGAAPSGESNPAVSSKKKGGDLDDAQEARVS